AILDFSESETKVSVVAHFVLFSRLGTDHLQIDPHNSYLVAFSISTFCGRISHIKSAAKPPISMTS
ncbi:hypothetical protein PF023_12860, partial [Enterococcus thailandicus]|uniref:hypothetical protein n=1 Tax=Enterococcus thailandicus TaxID=417368 RepID=UPI0022EBBA99